MKLLHAFALVLAAGLGLALAARRPSHWPIAAALAMLVALAFLRSELGQPPIDTGSGALAALLACNSAAACAGGALAALWRLGWKGMAPLAGCAAFGAAIAVGRNGEEGVYMLVGSGFALIGALALFDPRPGADMPVSARCAALLVASLPADVIGYLAWARQPRGYLVVQAVSVAFLAAISALQAHALRAARGKVGP